MKCPKKTRGLRRALKAVDIDEESGGSSAYGERFLMIPVKLIRSREDRLIDNLGLVTATSFQSEIGKDGL